MSGFAASWLALREPYDHAARVAPLVQTLAAWLGPGAHHWVDLGCGTGSNQRYLAARVSGQRWTLLDHDPALLALTPDVSRVLLDLRDPDAPWPDADVLVTQALLDLVSEAWLERLARYLLVGQRPLLAALSVDGRVRLHPSHPDDVAVMRAFRAHQLTDRGFGASLGPRAAPWLAGRLAAAGYTVHLAEADWQIPATDAAMVAAMVDGIAQAAVEAGFAPERAEPWRAAQRHSALTVGHLDLLALPPR